ncbi:hypothetical protein [Nocardioides sp. T2.26MG-1]|uniref:hypothetical protein n=1 Tax=Nocardioides sp. T2.26MG-1 TaxID=3041166 RepID=UPI002477613D|nr:hypothetical protein [Nocardioides sp. T2.26MG-1]CAI9407037.1 hypothetical protein HIDPHFAB_04706 [Nocardioides sp. T2.26MG-1]
MRLRRRERPPIRVERGERLLADTAAVEGHLGGTRDALYLVRSRAGRSFELSETVRIPWEDVEAADWDQESSVLRVTEVGSWGEVRPEHRFTIEEPARLLELVRERVTASIVLQRHVRIDGRRGLRVIARRAPRGDRPVQWVYEFDEGVDPDDPEVRRLAAEALAAAQQEVGPV